MSTPSQTRRRDFRFTKIFQHPSHRMVIAILVIVSMIIPALLANIDFNMVQQSEDTPQDEYVKGLDSDQNQLESELDNKQPENSIPNKISPPLLDYEYGYELAPPAPEVPPNQPPEAPHEDGIPPITKKYKDPAYIKSNTRSGAPKVVNETVLLILANFTDVAPTRTVSELENATFNTTPTESSVHNYYKEISYGVCNIIPGYLNGSAGGGWLKLLQTRKTYGRDKTSGFYLTDDGDPPDGNWLNGKGQLVTDALMAADNAGVDFAKYDNDGPDGIPNSLDDDGTVDHVLIIFAGNGQNHYGKDTTGNPGPDDNGGLNDWGRDLIWPSRVYSVTGFGTHDGKIIQSATVNPEDPSFTIPVGVTCHEFGHDLGLPDLYNTSSGASVVGKWEVMDQGNYNTNITGDPRPAHMGAWCKEQLGWVQPIIINETNNNQGVVQVNQTTSPTNESVCYRVNIEGNNEYYLIENRNKTVGTYDEALPNRGLLIWHIDDDMIVNWANPPGNPYHAILLEDYQNDLDEENYLTTKNSASWRSNGAADQADFNVTTAPNTSANGGTPSNIYLDRIQDNALWNMTIRILVKDDTDAPQPPQNVQVIDAEYDNGEIINITWDASADDGNNDDDVLYYQVYLNASSGFGPPIIPIKSVTATKAVNYKTQITGLIDGIQYNFTVRADDGPNVSPWPGNYTATPVDNIARPVRDAEAMDTYPDDGGNITLTWSLSEDDAVGNSSGPSDILWYNISMGISEGGGKNYLCTQTIGNTSYRVENLTNGQTYYFIITAHDDAFNNGSSAEINATPTDDYIGSPSSLQVTPSSWSNTTSFNIQWTNPIDNAGLVGAYYKLDLIPTDNSDFTNFVPGADIESLDVTDTLSDGQHPVYVWLRDGETNRNYSTAKSITIMYDGTPPASPIGLNANPAGWSNTNSFTVTWVNPLEVSGMGGAVFSINSPPDADNDGAYVVGDGITQISGITVPKQGENTIYVWLRDKAGNLDYTTNISVKVYLDFSSPGKPENILVTPNVWTNTNSFDITWTNPSDVSGIIGARYKLDTFPNFDTDGIYVAGTDITSIQGITVGYTGSHNLYLWLVDNATNSYYLNYNLTVLYYDIEAPSAPINFEVTPTFWSAKNSFTINWTNQWDHSGIAGAYYKYNSAPTSSEDGTYVPTMGIDQLKNLTVPGQGDQRIYIWCRDNANNIDHLNYSYTSFLYDPIAPAQPVDISPHPSDWSEENDFTVTWTNPADHSGVAGAYYKLDSPPTSDYDGTLVSKLYINRIDEITVSGLGEHIIYIWLYDRVDNIDYLNYNQVTLLFDDQPPGPPINLTVTPSNWTTTNTFDIYWTNPLEHSGIYGLYYWFEAPKENIGSLIIEKNISRINNFKIPGENPPSNEYTLYIWLIDNAFNMDYTKNSSQKLRYDITQPSISHTRLYYATKGLPITITASPTDADSGVREVKLIYKHESENDYYEQSMTMSGSIYTGEIPGSFTTTSETINYYLFASDNADIPNYRYYGYYGQVLARPGPSNDIDITITEADMIPPTITHQKVTEGIVGVKIALTATVTDDGSGVSEVKVFYKSSDASTFYEGKMTHGNPFYFEIPEQVVTMAGVEYFIYAVDNSARANEIYYANYGQTTTKPSSKDSYITITVSADDNRAPLIIYGPEVSQITSTTVTIVWITDEPADSGIDYDITEDLTIRGFNNSYLNLHSFVLSDLTPNTLYYYRVSSSDMNQNGPTRSNVFTFRTMRPGEEDSDADGIPDNEDPDDDNDGIPDTWEELNGLDPKNFNDADLDSDLDGYSNLLEFLSDSDPNNQRSTPISVGDTLPPIIIHEPKVSVKFLDTLTISVQVTDNGSGVRNVTIYYKSKSESEYFSIPMNKVPDMDDIYSYEIPREDVTLDDLEYFIKADDWASVTNTVYFGDDGLIQEMPNSDTDIDVDVREKKDTDDDGADSDDNFLEDIGGPFGLKHIGVCLLVIILLVVLLVCFIFAVRSAFQARALANHSTKYKTETVEGDRVLWEGEDMEELDEAEDLNTIGDEDDELQEGL